MKSPVRASRRLALKTLGVMAAFAAVGGILTGGRTAQAKGLVATLKENDYFAGLEGLELAGSTVTKVGLIEHGGVAIELVDPEGASFIVDVLRSDPRTPGVAETRAIAVYTRVGRGQRPTNERHGLAAMRLAYELGRRQDAGARVPALLTLRQRAAARDASSRGVDGRQPATSS